MQTKEREVMVNMLDKIKDGLSQKAGDDHQLTAVYISSLVDSYIRLTSFRHHVDYCYEEDNK